MSFQTTQFKKGHTPWNKNLKGIHLSPESQFKKGMLPWNKGKLGLLQFCGKNHWSYGKVTKPTCSICKSKVQTRSQLRCGDCWSKIRSEKMKGNKNGVGIRSLETRKRLSISRINNPRKIFKDTKPERIMEDLLKKYRIDYQKQIPLCGVTISDFFIPSLNIAIFCDGCYWHGCKIHRSIDKSVELNKKQNRVLRENGISVMRFWEHDLYKNSEDCIQKIINMVNFKL